MFTFKKVQIKIQWEKLLVTADIGSLGHLWTGEWPNLKEVA